MNNKITILIYKLYNIIVIPLYCQEMENNFYTRKKRKEERKKKGRKGGWVPILEERKKGYLDVLHVLVGTITNLEKSISIPQLASYTLIWNPTQHATLRPTIPAHNRWRTYQNIIDRIALHFPLFQTYPICWFATKQFQTFTSKLKASKP